MSSEGHTQKKMMQKVRKKGVYHQMALDSCMQKKLYIPNYSFKMKKKTEGLLRMIYEVLLGYLYYLRLCCNYKKTTILQLFGLFVPSFLLLFQHEDTERKN